MIVVAPAPLATVGGVAEPLWRSDVRSLRKPWIDKQIRLFADGWPESCVTEWPFSTNRDGYPIGAGKQLVARLVLEQVVGSCPAGMVLCHGPCHNVACYNPKHVYWGSRRRNMLDMWRDGTIQIGERNHRTKLTEADVLAIRSTTGLQRPVAEHYGIHPKTVGKIRRRQRWAWLDSQAEADPGEGHPTP